MKLTSATWKVFSNNPGGPSHVTATQDSVEIMATMEARQLTLSRIPGAVRREVFGPDQCTEEDDLSTYLLTRPLVNDIVMISLLAVTSS